MAHNVLPAHMSKLLPHKKRDARQHVDVLAPQKRIVFAFLHQQLCSLGHRAHFLQREESVRILFVAARQSIPITGYVQLFVRVWIGKT